MMKIICAFSLLLASSAFARGVCEIDSSKFCLGVLQLGHAELNQCLADHKDQLEPSCRASLPKNLKGRPQKAKPAADAAHATSEPHH